MTLVCPQFFTFKVVFLSFGDKVADLKSVFVLSADLGSFQWL